jgi:hypothetical protein
MQWAGECRAAAYGTRNWPTQWPDMATRKRKRGDEAKDEGIRDCPTQWAWSFGMPNPVRQIICGYLSPAETSVIRKGIWADMPHDMEFKQLQHCLVKHFEQLPSFPLDEFYRLGAANGLVVAGGSLFRLAHQIPLTDGAALCSPVADSATALRSGRGRGHELARQFAYEHDDPMQLGGDVDLYSLVSDSKSESDLSILLTKYHQNGNVTDHYDDSAIRSVFTYKVGPHWLQWIQVKLDPGTTLRNWIDSSFDFDVCKLACPVTDKGPGAVHAYDWNAVVTRTCDFQASYNIYTSLMRREKYQRLGCTIEFPADLVQRTRNYCQRMKWWTMHIGNVKQVTEQDYILSRQEVDFLNSYCPLRRAVAYFCLQVR